MLKSRLLPLVGALAMGAFIAAGAGSARASEITFGNNTSPTNNTCAANLVTTGGATDEGYVCNNGLTFTAPDGTTLTANGYSNWDITNNGMTNSSTATALTLKTDPSNSADESGLGENASGPIFSMAGNTATNGRACSDNPGGVNPSSTPCEIGVGAAVTVSSNGTLISDVLVGSVQATFEAFQVWTDIGGMWSQFGPNLSLDGSVDVSGTSKCDQVDSLDECQINLTTAASAIAVVDLAGNSPSDVLVTGVSLVPAPPIGHGLPAVIAVGGLLFGVWAWDRSKKRRLLGLGAAAIAHAAA